MRQTKINFNLKGMEELKRGLGAAYRTRVGILGSHVQRATKEFYSKFGYVGQDKDEAITNAELGLIQMYGSITNNIPPRDFLVMPIEHKKRELMRLLSSSPARAAFEAKDYRKIYEILGAGAVGFVDEAFATGGFGTWPDIKEATKRRKGSSAILIDTAELRKSQSFDIINKGEQHLNLAAPVKP